MAQQPSPETVGSFLSHGTKTLIDAGINTARLDTLVLLEDVMEIDRAQLLAHPDQELSNSQFKLLTKMIQRRAEHEPLAYIRSKTEFYGREFYVDHRVLEPRSESETMIDILLQLADGSSDTVVDIGTGSGALAITAKLELPTSHVVALDVDSGCLDVTSQNIKKLHTDIQLIKSDLLESVPASLLDGAILLCNLPYVPDNFQINPAAMREPRLAIFGGPDGLDLYRKLFTHLTNISKKPGFVLTEALPFQHDELKTIAEGAGFLLDRHQDFIQCFSPTQ